MDAFFGGVAARLPITLYQLYLGMYRRVGLALNLYVDWLLKV